MFKPAVTFRPKGHLLASLFTALMLTACATPNHADNIYVNTMISGELMPGVYGQVNIGSVPDYVTVYEEPMIIVQQPGYAVPMQPIYLYVPPYHAYHWRDHCGYYNACARPVYFVCANDYRPHYFESRYYNTRVYDPPRVYGRHANHNHNRHYETLYQREMNRDSRYHRVDNNKGPYYRENNSGKRNSYYPENNHHHNGNHRHQRHEERADQRPQQNRQQFSTPQPQPQRGNMMRVHNDNYRSNQRTEVRQAEYRQAAGNRVQMNNNDRMRERVATPIQQPRQQSSHVQGQDQRSFNRQQGGGHSRYGREEKR